MADVEEVAVLPLQTDQEEEKAGGNQKVEENKSEGEGNKDGKENDDDKSESIYFEVFCQKSISSSLLGVGLLAETAKLI